LMWSMIQAKGARDVTRAPLMKPDDGYGTANAVLGA
jgi:hypothetical protein